VTGSLISVGVDAAEIAPIWRAYWQRFWHRAPAWPGRRLNAFLTTSEGRMAQVTPIPADMIAKGVAPPIKRPPLVQDFMDGRSPFLGVVTLDGKHEAAADSGVLQFPEPGHLLTVAPTRTGKGASHIIPNLIAYAGSALVIDIKGENYDVTGEFRRRMYDGAQVYKFAPFEAGTHRYNPLDFVRVGPAGGPSPDTFDDARLLAEMLVPGKAKEEYWDVESRNLVTMLVLYVASRHRYGSPERTMAEIARLLFRADATADRRGIDFTLSEILAYARETAYRPLMALVTGFLEHEPKVRSNILSSCRADLRIWNSERLQHATSASDFTFADLKASMCKPLDMNPAPTTIYIVIPPEYLHAYRSVVRVMVGLGVVELTREGMWKGAEGWREQPPCPVLCLLDELPSLGYMEPVVGGLAYLAGYQVQLWSFAQNIGQLKEIYGDAWHNFPANAAVSCFFGVNDYDTAEFVSRLLGESEEEQQNYETYSSSSTYGKSDTTSTGVGSGGSYGSSNSDTSGTQEHVRFVKDKIAQPSDIRSLDSDLQIVFIRNTKPILSTKLSYYNFPLFADLYGQWRGPAARAR
jgi:type IV secretion system protein VirD4